jgi:hypothetical protein
MSYFWIVHQAVWLLVTDVSGEYLQGILNIGNVLTDYTAGQTRSLQPKILLR